jgi:C-terminal processing protease CtpA/Prc
MEGQFAFEASPKPERAKPLSFEKFAMTPDSTNNFYLWFMPDDFNEMRRAGKEPYRALAQEHPVLEARLRAAFESLEDEHTPVLSTASTEEEKQAYLDTLAYRNRIFDEHKQDLYDAYLIMRTHGSDADLFR